MVRQAIGKHNDLLTKQKLKRYGNITRSKGLFREILQGTVQGGVEGERPTEEKLGEPPQTVQVEAVRGAI